MEKRDLKNLPIEYRDALSSSVLTPPEFLINPEHPDADEYLEGINHLKRAVMNVTSLMTPKHVQIVKKWFHGERAIDIAQANNCCVGTVHKTVNAYNGKRLYALLQNLSRAVDGPAESERRAMLWRIARVAETRAPKTAIAAVAELNRMTIADYQRGPGDAASKQTVVVLNQTVIPRGALD